MSTYDQGPSVQHTNRRMRIYVIWNGIYLYTSWFLDATISSSSTHLLCRAGSLPMSTCILWPFNVEKRWDKNLAGLKQEGIVKNSKWLVKIRILMIVLFLLLLLYTNDMFLHQIVKRQRTNRRVFLGFALSFSRYTYIYIYIYIFLVLLTAAKLPCLQKDSINWINDNKLKRSSLF